MREQDYKEVFGGLMLGKTQRIRTQLCPHCGAVLDAASTMAKSKSPKPRDITICLKCATPLMFGDGLQLSIIDLDAVSPEDRKRLDTSARVVKEFIEYTRSTEKKKPVIGPFKA